jgi:8-oxo-dGTP pyrophosphatase MutT (NUDIX family)
VTRLLRASPPDQGPCSKGVVCDANRSIFAGVSLFVFVLSSRRITLNSASTIPLEPIPNIADLLRQVIRAHQPHEKDPGKSRSSAVLIPIFLGSPGNSPEVLFIRRADDLRNHAGQVAFPGGSREAGDQDLCATALREAQEEVGLNPEEIEVLGPLDDLLTVTDYHIRPFVGLITTPPVLEVQSPEVAEVFLAPLTTLLGTTREERSLIIDGLARTFGVYLYRNQIIWGATAAILRGLLKLLKSNKILYASLR